MSTITLNKLAEISSGQGAPQGEKCFGHKGLPFVRAGSLDFLLSGGKEDDLERVSEEVANEYQLKPYLEGTILFAKSGMSATKDRVYTLKSTCYVVNHLAAIIPNKPIDSDFLKFWFRHFRPSQLIKDKAYPSIRLSDIEEIKVPDFSYEKKCHIISILEKSESAKRKRQETNRLTDEFLKSVFIEMFGDLIKNPMKWPKKNFGEIFKSIRYGIGSPPDYQEKGIPFVRATNIKNGTVVSEGIKFISSEDAKKIEKCRLTKGNLVIVRSGVNAGDCGLISEEFDGAYAAYDLIVELPYYSAVFYNHLINSSFGKTIIAPLKRRAGQPHLNAEQIGRLKFISPDSALQQKFADLVQKVEALKSKQQESKQELDNLFNSLMQKVFKGEIS